MDLLKIDHRTVNLDRLATIIEEDVGGEGSGAEQRLTLVIGQDRIALDPCQSRAFLTFIHRHHRVWHLADVPKSGAVGEVEL